MEYVIENIPPESTEESLHDICDTIPQHRMTELAKIFAIALILENKERLLHIREEL